MRTPDASQQHAGRFHHAAVAWRTVSGNAAEPLGIEPFQDERYGTSGRKSLTFRLRGVGPDGASIIAKKGDAEPIAVARSVYRHLMPGLGGYALGFFGDLPSPDDAMWWIFLEDAGDEKLVTTRPDHRLVAAQWLAAVHVHTADWGDRTLPALPDRTCESYQHAARDLSELLALARVIVAEDVARLRVLDALAPLVGRLCQEWHRIENACTGLPCVLVHGDLIDKNMRLARNRTVQTELSMLAIDWEMAGWGTPAVDLASTRVGEDRKSLQEYCRLVRRRWPDISPDALYEAARAGLVMRTVIAIGWALTSVSPLYLERPFHQLPSYARVLREFLDA